MFGTGRRRALTLKYVTAGSFNWTDHLDGFRDDDDDRKAHTSDHYPLWAEFDLTG